MLQLCTSEKQTNKQKKPHVRGFSKRRRQTQFSKTQRSLAAMEVLNTENGVLRLYFLIVWELTWDVNALFFFFSLHKHYLEATVDNPAAAKSLQSCPTLCDPIDGSPLGSSVPGILQARTLEWVAISFSNAWKWKVKVKSLSHVWLLVTPRTAAYQAPHPWDFPGKSTGVGCHCLLW